MSDQATEIDEKPTLVRRGVCTCGEVTPENRLGHADGCRYFADSVYENKHHLTLYRTGRHGCWATCACGWKSRTFVGTKGAHLAFGEHLVSSPGATTEEIA